jgi:hypothetical protein
MIGMPTREQLEDQMRIAHEARMLWHAQAVERGEYDVHLDSERGATIVTAYAETEATDEQIEAAGITVIRETS